MFEKSLYDLIRGLRNHKGTEKEYIQNCLKECRAEIRSADIDLKATALLKLVYLEMVGHDMSWASFHVLEVMSSAKYHQKRVGYLGAVQSFRHDTEVLMLATNLLKKDLCSPSTPVISLPIAALPHLVNPSLALSVLSDLLPRLSHSNPAIRKKTIVTLYRLALVYPEALRAAWPSIKDRLMDRNEDPSVTAAIVNVVCELGWRRPRDFLPLAPRLFELLTSGANNWMTIKLIKLFATLTPLEPRLVRKLLPPLTELIRTTRAMSLLYECINGIIQGGILGSPEDVSGREEIATLCVNKLRSMIVVDEDANLTYVALLAFNKIVASHPYLVSQQEDVILGCIDNPDITIRIKALDLVQGMVTPDNLAPIVGRLMRQLKKASARSAAAARPSDSADSDEDPSAAGARGQKGGDDAPPLPLDYCVDVGKRILHMCSRDNYGNIMDFEWYIDVLMSLVGLAPTPAASSPGGEDCHPGLERPAAGGDTSLSERIGDELRNVAVKVKAMRATAVRAASIVMDQIITATPPGHRITAAALKSVVWLVGEYAAQVRNPQETLGSLMHLMPRTSAPDILAICMQAVPKLLAAIATSELRPWTAEKKTVICLLMARVTRVIGPLAVSPSLEVQERAVEFGELLGLMAEAAAGQPVWTDAEYHDPPLLLTQALPSLFAGWELNSVAAGAQRNVPRPDDVDLSRPIHPDLGALLARSDTAFADWADEPDEFDAYYHTRPPRASISSDVPAIDRLGDAPEEAAGSYQQLDEVSYLDTAAVARRRAERLERNRDDPFYIPPGEDRRTPTPIHSILQSANGPDLDIDKIPVLQLDLGSLAVPSTQLPGRPAVAAPRARRSVVIVPDETLAGGGTATPSEAGSDDPSRARGARKHPLLLDSSSLRMLALDDGSGNAGVRDNNYHHQQQQQQQDDAEMARAVREVERLRLEMQRANERIHVAHGVDAQGTVVRKKAKKAKARDPGASEAKAKNKKKKSAKPPTSELQGETGAEPDPGGQPVTAAATAIATAAAAPLAMEDGPADDDGGAGSSARAAVPAKKKKKKRIVEFEEPN